LTVAFFDRLEEIRPLCSCELKFRVIIKEHINSLLRMQNHYWRQRFTQRVMQFGDENTKFFTPWPLRDTGEMSFLRLLMDLEGLSRIMGN
jgi:hypothetical protein